jgi:hypothetical protein
MKYYIEYLTENESTYRRFWFYQVLIMLFSGIVLASILFGKSELQDYSSTEAIVDNISYSTMSVKPRASFDFRSFKTVKAIKIEMNNEDYFIRIDDEKIITELTNKIKTGDLLRIYYTLFEDYYQIFEIKKDSQYMLSFKEESKLRIWPILGLITTMIISVTLMILVKIKKSKKNR